MSKPAPDSSPFAGADEAAEAEALAAAEAQVAEGKLIGHATVRRWLLSWGREDELPPPACGR